MRNEIPIPIYTNVFDAFKEAALEGGKTALAVKFNSAVIELGFLGLSALGATEADFDKPWVKRVARLIGSAAAYELARRRWETGTAKGEDQKVAHFILKNSQRAVRGEFFKLVDEGTGTAVKVAVEQGQQVFAKLIFLASQAAAVDEGGGILHALSAGLSMVDAVETQVKETA